jgi:hypothetical protein
MPLQLFLTAVDRTNIADHLIDHISYENSKRKKEITNDYNNGVNGANTAMIKIVSSMRGEGEDD